jgi:serine/threonine protein kinase
MMKWVLSQMKGIVGGIERIHNYSTNKRGSHGDLRPENIILFAEDPAWPETSGGRLCIADFGLTKFMYGETPRAPRVKPESWGHKTYRPPEIVPSNHDPEFHDRSRKYDMWSVGCILMEYVVWDLQRSVHQIRVV